MGNYALAKQELFKNLKSDGKAIVNYDDNYKEYYLLKDNNIPLTFENFNVAVNEYASNRLFLARR